MKSFLALLQLGLLILLAGCQTRQGAHITFYSDPPGAIASGVGSDGVTFRNAMPTRRFWSAAVLPSGFPSNCLYITTPTITWPDGSKLDPTQIKTCNYEGTYTFKKPEKSTPNSSQNYSQNYSNGDKYYGQFKDGKKSGYGTYTYANGEIYIGNFVNNVYQGYGKFTWKNGNYYEGYWLDGKRSGGGVLYTKLGKVIYDGPWINDRPESLQAAQKNSKPSVNANLAVDPKEGNGNKCLRLGLVAGTDDYNLCIKSLAK